ncbi:MAG: hypothetical protein C0415_06470 [Thermodesulfovibrio sp.]|nr:hypothetical protein [Thermodesulfovibrio sp.]
MNRRPPKPLTMPELEKAKALYALGKSYHAIGCELNRDSKTIKKWLSEPETAKEIQVIKGELSEMFEGMAKRMLESITEEDIQKINAYQRVVSSGIATDKMRLLKGQSTSNISFAALIRSTEQAAPQDVSMGDEGGIRQ